MNEKEKSLELAKLMGWREKINPYGKGGLAQFAAILLKFPEVFEYAEGGGYLKPTEHGGCDMAPTQENILDEILKINGVNI